MTVEPASGDLSDTLPRSSRVWMETPAHGSRSNPAALPGRKGFTPSILSSGTLVLIMQIKHKFDEPNCNQQHRLHEYDSFLIFFKYTGL